MWILYKNIQFKILGTLGQKIRDKTGDHVQNECNKYLESKNVNQLREKEVKKILFQTHNKN